MNGQTYLPISWVNEHINKRFYWDGTENMLVYALPDQIVYADGETQGANGKPLLLDREDGVWLALGLVNNYTDVEILAFDSGDVKRVFVTDWGTRNMAAVKKVWKGPGPGRGKESHCDRSGKRYAGRCPGIHGKVVKGADPRRPPGLHPE